MAAVDGKVLRCARSRTRRNVRQCIWCRHSRRTGDGCWDRLRWIAGPMRPRHCWTSKAGWVTADAMHAQRETSSSVLTLLKGNQRVLHGDMKQHLYDPPDDGTCFCHQELMRVMGVWRRARPASPMDLGTPLERHRLAGSRGSGKGRGGVASEGQKDIVETPLLHDQRESVSAGRFAHAVCAFALGAGRDDERRRSAQPQGQRAVQPRAVAAAGPEHRPSAARPRFYARQAQTRWLEH